MRIYHTALFGIALVFVLPGFRSASAQIPQACPAFTIKMRETEYDAEGHALFKRDWTHYQSATGDFRVSRESEGFQSGTIYRRGEGARGTFFLWNSRTGVLRKSKSPSTPRLRTGEELLSDRDFVRTEELLGFTAYVLRSKRSSILSEVFIAAELSCIPLKVVRFHDDGRKRVGEPVSITFGEPAAAELALPLYPVIQSGRFNQELSNQIILKPDPIYPSEALNRGISGTIQVQVYLDESGRVLDATSVSYPPILRQAAVEAAYQARFSPTIVYGRPVAAWGVISYQFVLPELSKN